MARIIFEDADGTTTSTIPDELTYDTGTECWVLAGHDLYDTEDSVFIPRGRVYRIEIPEENPPPTLGG